MHTILLIQVGSLYEKKYNKQLTNVYLNIVCKQTLKVSSLSANPSSKFAVLLLIVETTVEMSGTHACHLCTFKVSRAKE